MSGVLFSVIVPVYNVESYLKQCIDSILAQTYRNFELILVDDGSQDSSGAICDEYAVRDSRIIVIHKENQGQLSARMSGLDAAAGEYICFVDSDDLIIPDYLHEAEKVVAALSIDVITFKWMKINALGQQLAEEEAIFRNGRVSKETYFKKVLSSANLNSLCKKICKRTLFDFDTDYTALYQIRNGEDLLQSMPIVFKANTFYYIDQALYLYRVNEESVTHKYRVNEHRILKVVRPMLYHYMCLLGYDSIENRNLFFQYYLQSLWQRLYRYCTNENCDFKVMEEIYQYPFVVKSRDYCKFVNWKIRIDLMLFFNKSWRLINISFKVRKSLLRFLAKYEVKR